MRHDVGWGRANIQALWQAAKDIEASGGGLRLPYYLSLLAQVCGKAGRAEQGLACIDEALAEACTQLALMGRGDTPVARPVTAHA